MLPKTARDLKEGQVCEDDMDIMVYMRTFVKPINKPRQAILQENVTQGEKNIMITKILD